MFVHSVYFDDDGLVLDVRPRWKKPRCSVCGCRSPGYDVARTRRWRCLGLGSTKFWLRYAPRRVSCPTCGIRTEKVPWAVAGSRFTEDFEELVAYLAQTTDKTHTAKLMGISWGSVDAIIERVVSRRLKLDRLDGLRHLGIDEFGYRKRHRYITTVVDHDRRRVIWAAPGRSSETLGAFFDLLGSERCAAIEDVTLDMAAGYIKTTTERTGAQIIFDRFHVQKLAGDAVDQVRREQLRDLRGTDEGRQLFRSRFALLKNPWNLTPKQHDKLATIQQTSTSLYRAYLLKEALAQALDYRTPRRADQALKDWLS